MTAIMQTVLFMLTVLAAVAVAARKLNVAPSILLVVAGVGMALIPGLPPIRLAPEVVLLVFLPPLIYSAGVSMSWREFRFNLRPITLLAFGCVVFTTCAVATAAHYLLGFDWGIGFVLGAIVAPPDTVAPLTIARQLTLPRRLVVVLEGEGLANDATALILYRFAVAAVSTTVFLPTAAVSTFALIVVGEIAFGIATGWLSLRLRKWAHDPRVEITLSLLTPYFAFWIPEHLGGSGVLATVACGLYVSWNGPLTISATTRLQGIFFWDLIVYLIEGMVFLLTGLQARALLEQAQAFTIRELIVATACTTLMIIAARFVWVFPATYVPRWASASLRRRDPSPPWQQVFLLSFTGIRGVVSLAAALALPYAIVGDAPFPHRELILFITFGVIIVTLVGQGLMLPTVVRWLGLNKLGKAERRHEIEAEIAGRKAALEDVVRRLETTASDRGLTEGILEHLRTRNTHRIQVVPDNLQEGVERARAAAAIKRELIEAERAFIFQLLRDGKITDEARRRIEYELDLEEASLNNRAKDGGGWI
ncbi:Na+/H+ antiporter [Pseudolabrys taiwanensis]|uniref:Na+/H+ antiporter n=1 Tax=Pseudolabrys taiwanensis TaxID=331696 RepID=A0A345ZYS6_9HYPH|nr:Na+/H+ antiporter [Pseudolabrys taiwanensis]AXK82073.1 Na+/H+ antiporter [Pseudolabrys taiwanensis]